MNTETVPQPAEITALEGDVQAFVVTTSLAVVDVATCQHAVNLRDEIKRRQAKITAFFLPLKDAAYRAHKVICQRESQILSPLNILDGQLRTSIQSWNDEQAAIARQRERELADKQRREAEAEAATAAAALETAGDYESATAVMEEAIAAPAPCVVVESAAAQVTGLKTRRVWGWRFVGGPKPKKDVVKETPPAIVARATAKLPREYLMVDVKKIDGIVDALKETTAIPGIEVFYDDVPVR